MIGENLIWRKLKNADIPYAEKLLRENEYDYVSACGRFLSRNPSKDQVWKLCKKTGEISGLMINFRSTLMPVLRGEYDGFDIKFLKGFLLKKKLHSVQGVTQEVKILENTLENTGLVSSEVFDYDLMSFDGSTVKKDVSKAPKNLLLRVPQLIDLDDLAPLQAGYEKEEVLPKGSIFSPVTSRSNLANIIANGQILAAELNGKLVGKINVSAVSFTRFLVGGVYVHPDFRGLGIAKRMTEEFVASLVSQGKGVTLFVKKNNIPARKIYADIGFKITGDYRITYYS